MFIELQDPLLGSASAIDSAKNQQRRMLKVILRSTGVCFALYFWSVSAQQQQQLTFFSLPGVLAGWRCLAS